MTGSVFIVETARLSTTGTALISADYRLLPPATGHEILEDVCDALAFVTNGGLNTRLSATDAGFSVDCNAVAVAGTSSGGLCAYLAAAHGKSRDAASPKALLSMYGMGANFLVRCSCAYENLDLLVHYSLLYHQ